MLLFIFNIIFIFIFILFIFIFTHYFFRSTVIRRKKTVNDYDPNSDEKKEKTPLHGKRNLWIGEKFSNLPESVKIESTENKIDQQFILQKSIIPTNKIFQIGLHNYGACDIRKPYNKICDENTEFCLKPLGHENKFGELYFNDIITNKNIKNIDINGEGVLYHFELTNLQNREKTDRTKINILNDYTIKYFPQVLTELKKKKLDLLIILPAIEKVVDSIANSWVDFDAVWNTKESIGSLFPHSIVE